MLTALDQAVTALPQTYPGPGGACAVLQDGEILARHAWGYANAERRIAFTPQTLFRMCSITKQFTCALVLDAFGDPSVLDADVSARLPKLDCTPPSALHLCHNQSGLRDYWAVAMLHGSGPEAPFGEVEAARVIDGTRSLHFTPGTRYAYCNQNFRILSDILQARTGESFADRLRTRIFMPAGMQTAFLAADTVAMPDGSTGYEGTQASGFRAAENRILWTGDAGLGASLDDMIAWERHIDATREQPDALYTRLCQPATFADGRAAQYGFGLNRSMLFGRAATGHGGALRGWRSHRLHVRSERLSVVVMFNHMSDAQAAASDLLRAALGERTAAPAKLTPPAWLGSYTDPDTCLAVRIEAASAGKIALRYGHPAETLTLRADGSAANDATRLVWREDALWMERPFANHIVRLLACSGAPALRIAGRYRCDELDAVLTVEDAGGVLYGGFSGCLGTARMETLDHVGLDVWTLPCPRALDHTPPGDWTLSFAGTHGGVADTAMVGCLIARLMTFARVGS